MDIPRILMLINTLLGGPLSALIIYLLLQHKKLQKHLKVASIIMLFAYVLICVAATTRMIHGWGSPTGWHFSITLIGFALFNISLVLFFNFLLSYYAKNIK